MLLGLPVYVHPSKAQLTRPAGSRRSGRVNVAVAELPADHLYQCQPLPVTSPSRTAIDIARARGFLAGLVTADAALRARTSPAELRAVLACMPRWPGAAAARLVADCADARSESPLESIVRARILQLNLPVPS